MVMWKIVLLLAIASGFIHNPVLLHGRIASSIHAPPSVNLRAQTCPSYHCATASLSNLTCVDYDQSTNEYLLEDCPSSMFCEAVLDQRQNSTCVPTPIYRHPVYPGSHCDPNIKCPSMNICNATSQVCQGGRQGAPCTVESTCDVGYICYRSGNEAYCNAQLDFGAPCNGYIDDTLCRNDAVCGLNTCVPWFSLPNGAYTISAYAAYACASGFYQVIPGIVDRVMCAAAPVSPQSETPIVCVPGSLCYSSDGQYSLPCKCGFNENRLAYCPLFPGDEVYRSYLDLLKQYSETLAECAFIAIGTPGCISNDELWEDLNTAQVEVMFWGLNQGNDDCVKAIYTYAYWNATAPNEA